MFFNTIRLRSWELEKAHEQTGKQDDLILKFFHEHRDMLTPCETWEHFQQYPLTSVRRSITTLTKKGFLLKTPFKRKGLYGKKNYCWTVTRNELTNNLHE